MGEDRQFKFGNGQMDTEEFIAWMDYPRRGCAQGYVPPCQSSH